MTDLLERRFSPLRNQSDDSNWVDVRRRARRPVRRIALVAALAVAAALLVAPAFGLGGKVLDVIKGSPAPPRVQTYFASTNQLRKQMFARAQAAGIEMHDRYSPVIASEVRGVAAIETADGPIYLWVGPTEDGGQCWLVEPHSGGCEPAGRGPPSTCGSCRA